MRKLIKQFGLWLALLWPSALTVAPQLTQAPPAASTAVSASVVGQEASAVVAALPAAPAAVQTIVQAPAALSTAAWVGATAIVAAIGDAWSVTIHGLNWDKDNAAASSDIRLEWTGAGMIPRTEHTVIWRYNPHQQTGYYSVAWHSSTGSWDNGAYAYGTHPWPANDCTAGTDGIGLTGNSGSAAQCWEEAGMGHAQDIIITPTGSTGTGTTVVKNKWYTQVRRVHVSTGGRCTSGQYQHDFYYDYATDTSKVIHYCMPSADLGSPTSPRFYFGGSLWEAGVPSAGKNDETLAGKLRCIEQYDTALTDADVATEAATCDNAAYSTIGQAHLWYANADPIPTDVADKKSGGTAHNPSWATANRPTQWDSTYSTGIGGYKALMGVGGGP